MGAALGERADVVELEPVAGLADLALAPISLPDEAAGGRRDVPSFTKWTMRRSVLCGFAFEFLESGAG